VIDFYASDNQEIMIVDKPVIYLYSEEEKEVNIQLNFEGDYTFTYPEYNNGWNVMVDKEGISSSSTSLTYPYLFWEGEMKELDFQDLNGQPYGFLVDTDTCISFLESSLSQLGFNSTETTDFITFWGPRLTKEKYGFIQFLIDDDYDDKIAGVQVSPQPESMRRVFMIFSSLKNKPEGMIYKTQELPAFNRKGFSLVEWGGSVINVPQNDI